MAFFCLCTMTVKKFKEHYSDSKANSSLFQRSKRRNVFIDFS